MKPSWKRWHFIFAVVAQFCYVAAQTGIFSYFINYTATDTPALSQRQAGCLQSYANGVHDVFRIPIIPMAYPAALFTAGDFTNISDLAAKLQNDPTQYAARFRFIWNQFRRTRIFWPSPALPRIANHVNAPLPVNSGAAYLDQQVKTKTGSHFGQRIERIHHHQFCSSPPCVPAEWCCRTRNSN